MADRRPGDAEARTAAEADLEIVRDGLSDIKAATEFTGLSRSMLYSLMEQGRLRYVKIGRARRIPRRALVELAAKNLRGGWQQS